MGFGAVSLWVLFDYFPGQIESSVDRAELVKLIAILVLVSTGVIFVRRIHLTNVLRNMAIWIGVAAMLIVVYSYQEELGIIGNRVVGELVPGLPAATPEGQLVIKQSKNGHFEIMAEANGSRIRFLIDTGASDIVLSPADARRIGIDPADLRYTLFYNTATVLFGVPPINLILFRWDLWNSGTFPFRSMKRI
jgi:aspartyl protease family protein